MDGDYRPGMSRDIDAHRFVEFSAWNMQPGITVWFKPAERVKGMHLTGNGFGDFGGSGFNASAVDGHYRDAGSPLPHPDAVIDTDGLIGLQGGKRIETKGLNHSRTVFPLIGHRRILQSEKNKDQSRRDVTEPAGPGGYNPCSRPHAVPHKCHFRGHHQNSWILKLACHAFSRLL